jgi:pentose-5-phosphate-3-epimerase
MEGPVSLELYTPFESLNEESWAADGIQLLAVQPGSQGQPLNPMIFERLQELQLEQAAVSTTELDSPMAVWIDGGVRPTNAKQLQQAGATGVTVGSHIWQAADPVIAYKDLVDQVS